MQSTMFVNGMSIRNICSYRRCSIFTGGIPTTRFQSDDKSNSSTQNLPKLKPRDGWLKIIVWIPNSHHGLFFQTLVWNWPHALRLLAVTKHHVDESPIHAQLLVSACTNNFPLTSGEVSSYYINWSKVSFDLSIPDIQEQNYVLHICWLCCKNTCKNIGWHAKDQDL